MRGYAVALGVLALAFLGRVLGQAIVALWAPGFLPPMTAWYSGLLPYPYLLPSQLVILALQAWISADLWRGRGPFARPRPRLGRALRAASAVYAAGMVVRYAATMALYPERRWLGGAIPIAFHFVLAAYLYVWGRFHSDPAARPPA